MDRDSVDLRNPRRPRSARTTGSREADRSSMENMLMLGIVGGTGLYRLESLQDRQSVRISTPFGDPSSPITTGRLDDLSVAFLARHGEQHELLPGEVNYRANIWALKSIGVTEIVSVSAVGSLEERLVPGSIVLPDQFIDLTKGRRAATFFGDGMVAHVSTAYPTCPRMQRRIREAAGVAGVETNSDKTYACIEGPRLGTFAESRMISELGGHVVGMTNVPEAFLAREAQMCYLSICIVTDYDAGFSEGVPPEVDVILAEYARSIDKVYRTLAALASAETVETACSCRSSLRAAVLTPEDRLSSRQLEILSVLRT